MAHLTDMDLDDIALVDRGANLRRHAVLKRDRVLTLTDRVQREIGMITLRKAAPSFGQISWRCQSVRLAARRAGRRRPGGLRGADASG